MPQCSGDAFLGVLFGGAPPRLGGAPVARIVRGLHVWFRGYVANRNEISEAPQTNADGDALRIASVGIDAARNADACASAYERWGAALSRHVLGEFALAIYDPKLRRLLLAHDELGLMPLFYAANANRIAFGTHLAALVDEIGVGPLDEEHLADYFVRAEHFGKRTPYERIARLLPGESVTWSDGRLAAHANWTLAHPPPNECSDAREEEARLRELLGAAVAAALPTSGTTLCELSGGLDSSTIFNLARRVHGTQLEAVSYLYSKSRSSDERAWMDVVLRAAPVPWHPIDADATPPFSAFPTERVGEPNAWVFNAALEEVYARTVRASGARVVLTGEGGDSVLGGDRQMPFFLADRFLSGNLRALQREARAWADDAQGKRSMRYMLGRFAAGGALARTRGRALEWRPSTVPWIERSYAKRVGLATRGRVRWLPPADSVGNAYVLQRVMRSAYIVALHYHQRSSPAPFRHPMLARPLLTFMLALPWERRIAPQSDRLLQRQAFRGIVPDATLLRRDKGGGSQPFFDGLDAGHEWRRVLTERPRIVERGYARLDAWRAAVELARAGQTLDYMPFRGAVILEFWLKQLEIFSSEGDGRVAAVAMPIV